MSPPPPQPNIPSSPSNPPPPPPSIAPQQDQTAPPQTENHVKQKSEEEKEEVEEEECAFCVYMKGGPCQRRFELWQECITKAEQREENFVEKCRQATSLLQVCMEMNADYYQPILDIEKAVDQQEEKGEEGAVEKREIEAADLAAPRS